MQGVPIHQLWPLDVVLLTLFEAADEFDAEAGAHMIHSRRVTDHSRHIPYNSFLLGAVAKGWAANEALRCAKCTAERGVSQSS